MPILETIGIVILGVVWGAQITLRPLVDRAIRLAWRLGTLAIFGVAAYYVYAQYALWRDDPLGKLILSDTGYFFGYTGTRILAPWLLAFAVAILIGRLARFFNKRFGERFMEPEEIPLFALGTFLTGYPGFLFYFLGMLIVGFILTMAYTLMKKGRAPLYYLWLPVAIFVIIIKTWLIPRSVLHPFIL